MTDPFDQPPVPDPDQRLPDRHAGSWRRRATDTDADRAHVPAGVRQPAACPAARRRAAGGQRRGRLAFSTDSFVISPLFFPGGDIGSLAIHGTVNDLAMCGAQPLALSAGLILEEGCRWRIFGGWCSRCKAQHNRRGRPVVTGDTKVVDLRKATAF